MTIDKQIDRSASPLTFVFDETRPIDLEQPSKPIADNENETTIEGAKTTTLTNPFEGFGSFC